MWHIAMPVEEPSTASKPKVSDADGGSRLAYDRHGFEGYPGNVGLGVYLSHASCFTYNIL